MNAQVAREVSIRLHLKVDRPVLRAEDHADCGSFFIITVRGILPSDLLIITEENIGGGTIVLKLSIDAQNLSITSASATGVVTGG